MIDTYTQNIYIPSIVKRILMRVRMKVLNVVVQNRQVRDSEYKKQGLKRKGMKVIGYVLEDDITPISQTPVEV